MRPDTAPRPHDQAPEDCPPEAGPTSGDVPGDPGRVGRVQWLVVLGVMLLSVALFFYSLSMRVSRSPLAGPGEPSASLVDFLRTASGLEALLELEGGKGELAFTGEQRQRLRETMARPRSPFGDRVSAEGWEEDVEALLREPQRRWLKEKCAGFRPGDLARGRASGVAGAEGLRARLFERLVREQAR